MAHPSTLRSPDQFRRQPRQQQQVQEQNWEDDQNEDFDVALHVASHAQRLKNVDRSLDHFEQSLKNFQAVYLQERARQNKMFAILAGCLALTVLVTAFWPRQSSAPSNVNAQAQQQRTIQQQLAAPSPQSQLAAPVQMPQAQQTYAPNFPAAQPTPQQFQQAQLAPVARPNAGQIAPVVALGARYDQQQRPAQNYAAQNYLAAPAGQPVYAQPAPAQVRLSPFQVSVQNKLSARGEAVPADWQPLFDREARGDKKGKLLVAAKFLKGDGVARDQAFAVEMIRQAADAGEKEAMMWLAYANQGGNIGKTDVNAAIRWFQAAGKSGVPQAYTELGRIYETGADGAPDLETAIAWYQRGAQAGDLKSAEAINRLTAGQAPPQQAAQPYAQQPSYAVPAQAGSPAQQLQQMIQPQGTQSGGNIPFTQNAPQDAMPVNTAANPNDLFVPASVQTAQLQASALQPTPDVDNEIDNSVAPAYAATSVVASVPTPAPSSQVGLSKEQAKSDNKAVQRMLRVLGYKVDRVDGEYGPQTAAAIRAYQRDHSVYPDGEPTAELINALMRDVRGQ